MSTVVTFKNLIGQEIVTSLIKTETNGDIVVKKPYVLNLSGFDQQGNAELQLMPLFLMNPDYNITLKSSYVASVPFEAPKVLETEYLEQSSSLILKLK